MSVSVAKGLHFRRWAVAVAFAMFAQLCSSASVFAQPVAARATALVAGTDSVDAVAIAQSWVDPSGKATLDAVVSRTDFVSGEASGLFRLGNTSRLWLRWNLVAEKTSDWVLTIPMPTLDHATLYTQVDGGPWQIQTAGDTLAVGSWTHPNRHPVFQLRMLAGQAVQAYIRIEQTTPTHFRMSFEPQAVHSARSRIEFLLFGAVFGGTALLIVFCFVQAAIYKDRHYLRYGIYSSLTMLAVAAYNGIAALLLWPSVPQWADMSQASLACLAAAACAVFLDNIFLFKQRAPVLSRAMTAFAAAGVLLGIAYLWLDKSVGAPLVGAYISAMAVLALFFSTRALRERDKVGTWVLAAHVPLVLAVLFTMSRLLGFASEPWLSQHAVTIAVVFHIPMLLAALNLRSRDQHTAIITEQTLSKKDALTGLLSGVIFADRCEQSIRRMQHGGAASAVVYVSLVNYASIRQSHGATVAEQSLLRCVIKLRKIMSTRFTLGRVGESTFGVLMPDVVTRNAAREPLVHMIASGLTPLPGVRPEINLQFNFAVLMLNEQYIDPAELQNKLSDTLARMNPRTRTPIRFIEPAETRPASLGPMATADQSWSQPNTSGPPSSMFTN